MLASTREKESPLHTLTESSTTCESTGTGSTTIILAEDVYATSETLVFKAKERAFTHADRLTIRAEMLSDDPKWHTGQMPTLIHTLPLGRRDHDIRHAVETSHVTIQGLMLLGTPVVEMPKPGMAC